MRRIGAIKKQRRKHTAEFKARIALEAIRGIDTINEIAAKNKDDELERAQLERKVGQLSMEVDWLEKKCVQLGIPGRGRNS